MLYEIIYLIFAIFLGYIVGRIGDYLAGHWNFFHHWVHGIILLILGLIYRIELLFYFGFFGIGLIISDFDDLLHFRIYGPDKKTKKKFFAFD